MSIKQSSMSESTSTSMHSPCAAVNDMRFKRKRFSISGSLLPLLLLLVPLAAQTSARPSSVNGTTKDVGGSASDIDGIAFDAGDDYADVDNVEWHHVKIVDGIMHEDHPIIMYKEDFVSEDYDPSQHNQHKSSSVEGTLYPRRRYKHLQRQRPDRPDIKQTEKYRALKPEKIYFDILPPTPVVVTDDSSSNDSKFDTENIRVEVISLVDDDDDDGKDINADNKAQSSSISSDNDSGSSKYEDNNDSDSPSKQTLNKRPKKYHHRIRRDTAIIDNGEHFIHKRHPHYNYQRVGSYSFDDYNRYSVNYWGPKHPVAGNKWNGIDGDVPVSIDFGTRFGSEDNKDRVVWGSRKSNRRPESSQTPQQQPQQAPLPPLFHNSNPEDADFSGFATRRPSQNNNRRPSATTRPQTPKFPPLFHNSNPEDADFSGFTRPAAQATPPTSHPVQTRPTSRPTSAPSDAVSTSGGGDGGGASPISTCVWAIVNCCSSSNTNIRYECFERLGCLGVFWDLNPCADNVKNSILDFVDQYQ